jgi:F-type H+-transporting ATPase subunit gamma
MPSLKDLKVRIKSVKSTQKITKAMKMVAASKLRRAREAAEASRPYATAMEAMVARLADGYKGQADAPKLLAGTGRDQNHLLLIATADRGLCGAFNSSITKATRKTIRELEAQGKTVKLYYIGRKGRDLLGSEYKKYMASGKTDIGKRVSYDTARDIADEVFDIIERDNVDVVTVVYNHFKSAIQQIVTFQQLMPLLGSSGGQVVGDTGSDNPTTRQPDNHSYEYEPEEQAILADLLPRNFSMQIFKALLESSASEQGARMNAMENATKNAGEMIKKLSLKYNRTRQANITKELIEIISGAEAL